jgi:hypothetical protein
MKKIKPSASIGANFDFDKDVSYNPKAKDAFLTAGELQLWKVAAFLGLEKGQYDIRVNRGGDAVSGEVTLHTDKIYIQLSQSAVRPGAQLLYRTVTGRRDHTGGVNHVVPADTLNWPDIVARYVRNILPRVEAL